VLTAAELAEQGYEAAEIAESGSTYCGKCLYVSFVLQTLGVSSTRADAARLVMRCWVRT
jgi:hypothetical protein